MMLGLRGIECILVRNSSSRYKYNPEFTKEFIIFCSSLYNPEFTKEFIIFCCSLYNLLNVEFIESPVFIGLA